MRRRGFIGILAGAAAWPTAGRSDVERLRRVGVLMPFPKDGSLPQAMVTTFTQAMGRLGWVEGRNIQIDFRFAAGDATRLKTYAAELVGLKPDAIVASTLPAVAAMQAQTRTIPIVFVLLPDPVGQGFVQSLSRPGGNMTGFGTLDAPMMGKWLQLLKDVAPSVTRAAVIFNPDTTPSVFSKAIEGDAPSVGLTVTLAPVHDDAGIEAAVATQAAQPGGSLICLPDPFNAAHQDVIVGAAARYRLPLLGTPNFPRAGGLMSYLFDPVQVFAQAATYIDRILRGANPAELPVQEPTKFTLIINLKTAKALGLTVPLSIMQQADEVIE